MNAAQCSCGLKSASVSWTLVLPRSQLAWWLMALGIRGLCTVPLPGNARGGQSPAPSEPRGALVSSRSIPVRSLLSESRSTSAPAQHFCELQQPNVTALSDPRDEGSCNEQGQRLPHPRCCTGSCDGAKSNWAEQFWITAHTSPACSRASKATAISTAFAANPGQHQVWIQTSLTTRQPFSNAAAPKGRRDAPWPKGWAPSKLLF